MFCNCLQEMVFINTYKNEHFSGLQYSLLIEIINGDMTKAAVHFCISVVKFCYITSINPFDVSFL